MTVRFSNCDKLLTDEEVSAVERDLSLDFPLPLKALFLENNGGVPEPYLFQSDFLEVVVNETLPLLSKTGRVSAREIYFDLAVAKRITPRSLFPFAVDPCGDYFFVDCEKGSGAVHLFRSDSSRQEGSSIISLGVTLPEFWDSLVPEDS